MVVSRHGCAPGTILAFNSRYHLLGRFVEKMDRRISRPASSYVREILSTVLQIVIV